MKRSESVLVYGVTGVFGVILAIAIIWGGQPTESGGGEIPGVKTAGAEFGDLVDDENDRSARLDELLGLGSAPDVSNDTPKDSTVPKAEPETTVPFGVPLSAVHDTTKDQNSELDGSRIEETLSGRKYRHVPVLAGDSIGLIVQRWCPVSDLSAVAALNETRDLAKLRIGDEICVPFVDSASLAVARRARLAAAADEAVVSKSAGTSRPVTSSAKSREYTVKDGESLWVIAERVVGENKAMSFINDVLALNPSIQDASRIRADMKILLPK